MGERLAGAQTLLSHVSGSQISSFHRTQGTHRNTSLHVYKTSPCHLPCRNGIKASLKCHLNPFARVVPVKGLLEGLLLQLEVGLEDGQLGVGQFVIDVVGLSPKNQIAHSACQIPNEASGPKCTRGPATHYMAV